MRPTILIIVVWLLGLACCGGPWVAAAESETRSTSHSAAASQGDLTWHNRYRDAREEAEREGKMLFILFCAKGNGARCDCLEDGVLADPEVRAKLKNFVRLRVPVDVTICPKDTKINLISHPSLAEMQGREGMAIIDFAHRDTEYYRKVVSCFPMLGDRPYSVEQTRVIVGLPAGTLTQRTLIYAVRTHPERPASTDGQLNSDLIEEAESHSQYQARICLQGHHNWETRFQRIFGRIRGVPPTEVCAESWPGEGLLQGAIECVRCWRLSSGHWSAVRGRHGCFGYDMRRGRNGVWYATGIFGGQERR